MCPAPWICEASAQSYPATISRGRWNATLTRPTRRGPATVSTPSATVASPGSPSSTGSRPPPASSAPCEPRPTRTTYLPSGGRATGSANRSALPRPLPPFPDAGVAHHGVRTTEQPGGGGQVAVGDGGPDLAAADGTAVELERRHHDHVPSARCPERPQRRRRTRPLVAEGGVRGHQEPGQRRAGLEPVDEPVVRRLPQGLVEMHDDGRLHARGLEALNSLVRVAQQRRGAPP